MEYEYEKTALMPDWLREFANSELKKCNGKFGKDAVEAMVEELKKRVGLDQIEPNVKCAAELIPGGLAEGKKDDEFDKEQIQKGIKVEKEHTDSKDVAKEITKDHLVENDKYYDYLEDMEKKMDKKSQLIRFLLIKANQYEEVGNIKAAQAIDKMIFKLATKETVFDKHPELSEVINHVCRSRAGFVDGPAILHAIKSKFEGFEDSELEELKEYIDKKLDEEKKTTNNHDEDPLGMSYTVFVIDETENDGNKKVL